MNKLPSKAKIHIYTHLYSNTMCVFILTWYI